MSLTYFHMFFLLFAIMGADLFGGWAIHEYNSSGDAFTLILGVISLIGGVGLAGYVLWFVHKAEVAHLE